MANLIQLRRDTAANWTAVNPILAQGEPGVELDTNRWKIGNGTSTWAVLQYQGTQLPSNNAGYLYNNGTGTLSWGAGAGGGVTSVGMSMGTTGLTVSPATITTTGTFAITGTLAIVHGGTGATTAHHALNALLPDQSGQAGKFLGTNGTTASWETTSYTLPKATTSTLGGVIADGTSITVDANGVISAVGSGSTVTVGVTSVGIDMGTTGLSVSPAVVTSAGTFAFTGTLAVAHGGTGVNSLSALQSALAYNRNAFTGTTTVIAPNTRTNVNVTAYKGYVLYKIHTSDAAWVTLYVSDAARTADASRPQGVDPAPGSGVIAEAITTGTQTVIVSPGVYGFNDETPTPTTVVPVAVKNLSGSTTAITVTLTLLQTE